MFTPNGIPNKHTAKLKSNKKRPRKKLGCAFCISVEYKKKKKIYFLSPNTKYMYISSSAVKISAFSLVLCTHEKYWFYHCTWWNIFGIHLNKVNILYKFTFPLGAFKWTFTLEMSFMKDRLKLRQQNPHLSHNTWFPTMWHFDNCRLRRTYAASFKA